MSGYIGTQPVPQATQTRDSFTATANQTSFATSGYTPEFLDVFLNGVKLAASDYTATNGSDVVLASGAAVNDILEVVAYSTFEVLNPTFDGNVTFTGNASFGDNDKAIFGDGNDLQIYHDGSQSIISDVGSGNLNLEGDSKIVLRNTGGSENYAQFFKDGAVELYYNNAVKIATTSTGVDVTGTVTGSTGITTGVNYGNFTPVTSGTTGARISANGNGMLRLASGGVDKMYVLDSGRVGIGTSSPPNRLSVKQSGNTSAASFGIVSINSANDTYIGMGYDSTSDTNRISSSYSSSGAYKPIAFLTSDTERMRIDSSGNLLVGKTTGAFATAGTKITSTGNVEITAASDGALALGRTGSDGYIQRFYKDSALVGSIGVSASNNLAVGSTSGSHSGITFGTNTVAPMNVSNFTNADDTYDLGNTSARWKDAYLSGGIYLGGTGSANKLDDYEEGSYTPTFLSTTGANPTVTYVEQSGTYTKVGNLITCFQRMRTSAVSGGSGNVLLGGLPFNCNDKSDETGGSIGLMLNITGATGNSAIQVDSSTNAIFLMKNDVNSAYPVSALGNNTYLRCTFQYLIE